MGCWLLLIEPVHCGSNSILKVRFWGHPVDAQEIRYYLRVINLFLTTHKFKIQDLFKYWG